jgi:hypothetical protein
VQDLREGLRDRGIVQAIRHHDTAALFDWLIEIFSLQGISDAVAVGYIAQHGNVRYGDIASALSQAPSCDKLTGYWRFYDCQYAKATDTCSEPSHLEARPLPAICCATVDSIRRPTACFFSCAISQKATS